MIPESKLAEIEAEKERALKKGYWNWVTDKLVELIKAQDAELEALRARVQALEAKL